MYSHIRRERRNRDGGGAMSNLDLCIRCPFVTQGCMGPCACTADQRGRDIIDIAAAGDCPKGYFAAPETMPAFVPPPATTQPTTRATPASEERDCGCTGKRREVRERTRDEGDEDTD
jgi:hypothetical protein